MGSLDVTYALPVSCIRVEGTITETVDLVLQTTTRAPEVTAILHVHGIARDQTLRIQTGWLRDTSVSLELTEDGRLKSTSEESTGQLGQVVLGVVGAGASFAALLTGVAPTVLAGAAHAGAVGGREVAVAEEVEIPIAEQTPEQKIAAAYAVKHERIARLRGRYVELIDQTAEQIAAVSAKLIAEPQGPGRWRLLEELRQHEELLPVLRSELEPLNAHFAAWRASTITTRVEHHQRCFSLDALRGAGVRVTNTGVAFAGHAEEAIRFAWEQLGIAVSMEPAGVPEATPSQTHSNKILTRLPRRVRLCIHEKVDGRPVLRDARPHLVVDAACPTELVPLRRSLWAKRAVTLGFSALGTVTAISSSATSSAVAAANTLGGLPASVVGGLEQATKIRGQVATLHESAPDEQLEATKRRVELKQKELELAGLAATGADYAELERLKQQADILAQRKSIADAAEADPR